MKTWEVDTCYRPPSLFGGVKNGFQGVPERYKWVPHAMLANRRSRAGYPPFGDFAPFDKDAAAFGNIQGIPGTTSYSLLSKSILCFINL